MKNKEKAQKKTMKSNKSTNLYKIISLTQLKKIVFVQNMLTTPIQRDQKQRATKSFVSKQLSAQRQFETQGKTSKVAKQALPLRNRIINFLKRKQVVLGFASILAGFAGLEFIHRIFKPDIRLIKPTQEEYNAFITDMYSLKLLDIVNGDFFQMTIRDRLKAKYQEQENETKQQETL